MKTKSAIIFIKAQEIFKPTILSYSNLVFDNQNLKKGHLSDLIRKNNPDFNPE